MKYYQVIYTKLDMWIIQQTVKFENLCLPNSNKFEKSELFFCSILKPLFHNAKQKLCIIYCVMGSFCRKY